MFYEILLVKAIICHLYCFLISKLILKDKHNQIFTCTVNHSLIIGMSIDQNIWGCVCAVVTPLLLLALYNSSVDPYLSSCELVAIILRMLLSAKGQPERLKDCPGGC